MPKAARSGKSLSALIRGAVERVYGSSRSSVDDLNIMRQTFDSWADRDEDGATMVERLRSGTRFTVAEYFAKWLCSVSQSVDIEILYEHASGGSVAAHWRMSAESRTGT